MWSPFLFWNTAIRVDVKVWLEVLLELVWSCDGTLTMLQGPTLLHLLYNITQNSYPVKWPLSGELMSHGAQCVDRCARIAGHVAMKTRLHTIASQFEYINSVTRASSGCVLFNPAVTAACVLQIQKPLTSVGNVRDWWCLFNLDNNCIPILPSTRIEATRAFMCWRLLYKGA